MDVVTGGLAHVELFTGLSAEAIAEIESSCVWRRLEAGEPVFDRDTDSLEVYFVVEGAVRILTHADDREVALADVVAGNYFGELAAIDGMGRSARAVASRSTVVASLDRINFLRTLQRYPQISVHILQRLARIVRNLDQRVTRLSTQTEGQRVCGELVRLAQPEAGRADSWLIPDLPNHKEIAAWAGTSREAVAQAIGELARDGVVKRRGMGLLICDWARLQLLATADAA